METIYFSQVKKLRKFLTSSAAEKLTESLGLGFRRTKAGLCSIYHWKSHPLFVLQNTTNFKKQLFLGGVPTFYMSRRPSDVLLETLYPVEQGRARRIYLNVGSLPYRDNRSGIPRVAKELSAHGLRDVDGPVFPVYADPVSGLYRFAGHWAKSQSYDLTKLKAIHGFDEEGDAPMTLQAGDWFVHAMINPSEVAFFEVQYQQMRRMGVNIGFVLHDLIAERHPEYYRKRAANVFSRWLRMVVQYDGIFPISKATLTDFVNWSKENRTEKLPERIVPFYLGADFSAKSLTLDVGEQEKLDRLVGKSYFLQVSTIEPRKGFRQLLDAFEVLWARGDSSTLVLVGRQGWMMQDFCNRVRKHAELGRRLFWFSGISDGMLTRLYQGARCVVVASEAEGFGLSVVEGAYWKRPLLVRDIAPFREVAPTGTFFFSNDSPEALADALHQADAALEVGQWHASEIEVKTWTDSFNAFVNCFNEDDAHEVAH